MEFSFDINKLFREEITLIDSRLQPCRQHGIDRHGFQQLQRMLYEVVDKMGDASAKAQGLHGSITTGKKLELANHRLYVMKDTSGNRGQSSVLGILKVGRKKLFVYDSIKAQHELDPLCVLDFYVCEARQRMGCGRKLFDFMLSREGIPVEHLAVDRPSPKFLSFLKKHYQLRVTIPQVNNFVIFENFFNNRSDTRGRGGRSMVPGSFADRVSPRRPGSGHRADSSPHYDPRQVQTYGNRQQQQTHSAERSWTPSMAKQSPSHMGAGDMMYSRHRATPPLSGKSTPSKPPHRNGATTPTRGPYSHQQQQQQQHQYQQQNHYQQQQQQVYQQQQQQQHQQRFQETQPVIPNIKDKGSDSSASFYKQLNAQSSPSMFYNMGASLSSYRQNRESGGGSNNMLEHLPPKPPAPGQRPTGGNSSFSTPNFGNRAGGGVTNPSSAYPASNQQSTGVTPPPPSSCAPLDPRHPVGSDVHIAPPTQQQTQQQRLPQIAANQQQENVAHRPPSGKQGYSNSRRGNSQPPVLQRDGPPANYKEMLNMHQAYQGRNGHLNVPNGTSAISVPGSSPYGRAEPQNTSWTVTGVLREQRLNAPVSNRFYNPTRLW